MDQLATAEAYFREREAAVSRFEQGAGALEAIAREHSLTGGPPLLDDLIDLAGEHLEEVRSGVQPQIDGFLKTRKRAAALKPPRVRQAMTSIMDRNLALMRRYLRAVESLYERLITLRDLSIQQSVTGVTQGAWSGLWADDE
ncbi:MAG: hypothetical protein WAM82_05740 [Thermoanaerobaculia bacterium]